MSLKKLRPLGNGIFKWEVALRIDDRRIHRKFDDTPEGAAALYAELLKEKNRADFKLTPAPATHHIKLEDAVSKYNTTLLTRNMNAKHIETVGKTLEMLKDVAGAQKLVGHVTPATIVEWQNRRRLKLHRGKPPSGTTINRDRAHLSAFFEYCVQEMHWIPSNPVANVKKVKQLEPPLRSVTFEEFSQLADMAWKRRPALALLIEILGESGCRIGEAMRANAGDVKGRIWEKRVKGGRLVKVLAESWVQYAAQRKKPDAPLCPREDGKRFVYRTTLDSFRLMCKKAGLREFTPHCLRHGRATWDVEAGAQGRAVQQKLAHTSIATTERYFREANALAAVNASIPLKRREPATVCHMVTKPRDKAGRTGMIRDKRTSEE